MRNSVVLSRDESKFRQVQPMYSYFIHHLIIYRLFGAVVVVLCCCATTRWFEFCHGILYFDTLSQLRPESHRHAGNAGHAGSLEPSESACPVRQTAVKLPMAQALIIICSQCQSKVPKTQLTLRS